MGEFVNLIGGSRDLRVALWVVALVVAMTSVAARAQQAAPVATSQEALLLAQGWGYLSSGDSTRAAAIAAQLLAAYPLSDAGVALAVEAELPRSGWLGALNVYEQWMGARRLDNGYTLRRIARASLHEALKNVATRPAALEALIADGDPDAIAQATAAMGAGKFSDTRALAVTGDDRAVKALITQLDSLQDGQGPIIDALGQSHNRVAIPPLLKLLSDPRDNISAAAADALGRLGFPEVIDKLRPLLAEDHGYAVRFTAARALGRLGDPSGVIFLRQAMDRAAGAPGASLLRIQAAAALAAIGPDTGFIDTARALLNDPDPYVRTLAAEVVAPFDNALAKSTLQALESDPNPAIRQKAAQVMAQHVAGDLSTLRSLLRSADAEARTFAAGRILELTR